MINNGRDTSMSAYAGRKRRHQAGSKAIFGFEMMADVSALDSIHQADCLSLEQLSSEHLR